MFIHRVANALLKSSELHSFLKDLSQGKDVSLACAQSVRPLVVASLFAEHPKPTLFVVAGEEAAQRTVRTLAAWLGLDQVMHYPDIARKPWSDAAPHPEIIGARCKAVETLALGEPKIVVASAASLMRMVPPQGSAYYASLSLAVGDQIAYEDLPVQLVAMGYTQTKKIQEPGQFSLHGDTLDIFPAQDHIPVRIEFFGDEIDRMRRMVLSTTQTVADLESITIYPARELAFTPENIDRAERALYAAAQNNSAIAADLELIQQAAADPALDRYMPALYGSSSLMLEHMSDKAQVILAEPRALFDDCMRAYDEIYASAQSSRIKLDDLFVTPQEMDFGKQQRISLVSMLRAQTNGRSKAAATLDQTDHLSVQQPQVAGSDSKLLGRVRTLINDRYSIIFAVPDRQARDHLKLRFSDEHLPFVESLGAAAENALPLAYAAEHPEATSTLAPLSPAQITFIDAPVPAGIVIPTARLAILSITDLSARSAKSSKRARKIDPTSITFPFKPGDYVVHAHHGIALFSAIVRQDAAGKERDYFLLEYAAGDKLYVPLEQVDRLTRYVGPDGDAPRLTRLNSADWTRATNKARKSAKKLAFDLVDLYTRRASVQGYAFAPDTSEQQEMEASFSYDLTPDQAAATADIKADMEAPKPMDRLLCGDVGFGKTEVALRAAFKAVSDGKQVMVLCPTTILAEQHYQTFFARFTPFEKSVAVLSRFVTPAKQKRALKAFAEGELDVLIGTHRLLSADVNPLHLGLVIIDEEQRFGVAHKEQLKNLREQIDVLTLSATPIPRTMQMAMSGVRDMSLIMTPPPGRLPVKVQVGEYDGDVVNAAIRAELERGGQVYYVSNRVGTIGSAVERVEELVPEARVAYAHGQMSPREVEDVMLRFTEHEVDVLVATTIIESGIDNPRTNTLIIEDSQRLGLAQLYQLKGRVGRGRTQAYAYFMFPPELPLTQEATDRLTALAEFQDLGSGMKIAMRDLEIRGAGSLMGAEQHGNLSQVGFDLFTQMLGEAVAQARGEAQDLAETELNLNLAADFYLDEDYLPDIDKRVLIYRQLASVSELSDVDKIASDLENRAGAMPLAARNLFDRARIRIRAERLGITSIALVSGRIIYQGVLLDKKDSARFKARRAIYYATSHKLAYPFHKGEEELVPAALGVLEELGGSDELDSEN